MEGDDSFRRVMSRATGSVRFVFKEEETYGSHVVPQFKLWPPQETAHLKNGRPLKDQPRARVRFL